MNTLKQGLLIASLLLTQPGFTCTEDGSEGFLPENDLKIHVGEKNVSTVTEEEFNAVIDHYEAIYAPIIAQEGGTLEIQRNWADPTVNAFAQRIGTTWRVSMFGGLARHNTITSDGFALVVCHEIGHHIGGAPKKLGMWSNPWASNEGQADYFATLKCLRRAWMNDNNMAIVNNMSVPAHLTAACSAQWSTEEDRAICLRGGMAGMSVGRLFAALRRGEDPKFETPDTKVVSRTDDNHPATQCRLDTYFQGALCEVGFNEDVNQSSEVTGTCHGTLGHQVGLRPLCWFKPAQI
jgi:hypothetical protein